MPGNIVSNEFLQAFAKKAKCMGFIVAEVSPEASLLELHLNGEFAFRIMTDDEYHYRRSKHEPDKVLDLIDIFSKIRKEYRIFESATPLPYQSLSHFRLLNEFGNHLMAARLEADGCSLHYVTWEYDYDRKGVSIGHYFGDDYEGAKRDYVLRAGFINKDELFTEEEYKILHKACVYRGLNGEEISMNDEINLRSVISKIEYNIPAFCLDSNEQQQDFER